MATNTKMAANSKMAAIFQKCYQNLSLHHVLVNLHDHLLLLAIDTHDTHFEKYFFFKMAANTKMAAKSKMATNLKMVAEF